MTTEELLALSDERDMWLKRVHAAYTEGRAVGRKEGVRRGETNAILALADIECQREAEQWFDAKIREIRRGRR